MNPGIWVMRLEGLMIRGLKDLEVWRFEGLKGLKGFLKLGRLTVDK